MQYECKTFPNATSANAALNAAKATWTPPVYVHIGGGRHVDIATLPEQVLSLPVEMVNGKFAVIADHPGFKGEFIDPDVDFKRPADLPLQAQAVTVAKAGASSGIVAKPGAEQRRKDVA